MQILGHHSQRQFLSLLLSEDRLPHALLFCGIPGVGKRLLALELAEKILTRSLDDDSLISKDAGINLIHKGDHPDLYFLTTKQNKKSIGVEEVRDLQERLALTPYYRTGACIIIEDAEKLSIQASNSLLKTLEEPIANRYFILISSCPHLLPPTILSRSQKILVGSLKPQEILDILNQLSGVNINSETLQDILPILNGSLELLSLETTERHTRMNTPNQENIEKALVRAGEMKELIRRFSNIYDQFDNSKRFISEISHLLSSLEKNNNISNNQIIFALNTSLLSKVKNEKERSKRLALADTILELSKKWDEVKSRNLNINLQLTSAILHD